MNIGIVTDVGEATMQAEVMQREAKRAGRGSELWPRQAGLELISWQGKAGTKNIESPRLSPPI